MHLPVDDATPNQCPECEALNRALDALLAAHAVPGSVTCCGGDGEDRVLIQLTRWVVRQTLAKFDGDADKLMICLQHSLNEPQNAERALAYLRAMTGTDDLGTPLPPVRTH